VARSGLAITLAAAALVAGGCTLPEAPAREARTNELAARGNPFPTPGPKAPGAPAIDVEAVGKEPAWKKSSYTVKAGVVNISFTSPEGSNHNLNLVGPGAPYPILWGEEAGSSADHLTQSVELQKGTYEFFCSVQGHRTAGMAGTITAE
jgi:plastocyanin